MDGPEQVTSRPTMSQPPVEKPPPVAPKRPQDAGAKPPPPPPKVAPPVKAKPSPKLAPKPSPKLAPKPVAPKPAAKLAPSTMPRSKSVSIASPKTKPRTASNASTKSLGPRADSMHMMRKPSAIRMEAGSSVADMEDARRRNTAYEYLCHIEETRTWMQACLKQHAQKKEAEELATLGAPDPLSPEERMLANLVPGGEQTERTESDDDLPPPPPEIVDGEEGEEPVDEYELPPAAELEERLRNGVLLVKLAQFFTETLSDRRIYDKDEKVYKERGLVFRHTDNILQWIKAMEKKGLPKVFFPEVTDIYDKKNMPKAIYCLHALSRFLFSKGIGPVMEDLHGVAQFTEEEINAMDAALAEAGVQMPQFGKIGGVLAAEVGEDEAAVHAAILAINKGIEDQVDHAELYQLLMALAAGLDDVRSEERFTQRYKTDLGASRSNKVESNAKSDEDGSEVDIYDVNLTKDEIQLGITTANENIAAEIKAAKLQECVDSVNAAVDASDIDALATSMGNVLLNLEGFDAAAVSYYLPVLASLKAEDGTLTLEKMQPAVNEGNAAAEAARLEAERLASIGYAVSQVNAALSAMDSDALILALQMEALNLPDVRPEASMEYIVALSNRKPEEGDVSAEKIEEGVAEANNIIDEQKRAEAAVAEINELLFNEDPAALLERLQANSELLELPTLADAAARYHAAFSESAKTLGKLTQNNIQRLITEVNQKLEEEQIFRDAIAAVIAAASGDDPVSTFAALQHGSLALSDIREEVKSEYYTADCAEKYHSALKEAISANDDNKIDQSGIQQCIFSTNTAMDAEQALAEAIGTVNAALAADDIEVTLAALTAEVLNLQNIDEGGAEQYHENMKKLEAPLTRQQMQEQVDLTNFIAEENSKHAAIIFTINDVGTGVESEESYVALYSALSDKYSRIDDALESNAYLYFKGLVSALQSKAEGDDIATPWKISRDDEQRPYYYNKETKETLWFPPDELAQKYLSKEELQELVSTWNHYNANESKVLAVQAQVRGALQMKRFRDRKQFIESQAGPIVKLQSMVRMIQQRRRFKRRLDFLNAQEDAATRIQAGWKGMKVRRNYKGLTKVNNPPVNTVRRFLHLLDQSEVDFTEELQVGKLKETVVTAIKQNHQLEADIHDMDVKIELLVKNRIELQSVVNLSKSMQKKHNKRAALAGGSASTKSWWKMNTAESRARRESYQHLFYLLQTNPEYLAALVFVDKPMKDWSQIKAQKFLDKIIQTTYNFGSNAREKYLLVKLFQVAQRKEILEKVTEMKEFLSGQPTVVRLAINHFRKQGSDNYFVQTLRKPVMEILNAKELDLTTDPCDVYKQWVNRTERETGESMGLPHEVEREDALKHEEVRKIISETVTLLLTHVSKFLDAVVNSVTHLPFGLRHLCMCLKLDLMERFADATEDQVNKIVSNLLYYRFLNPVITAPEGVVIMGEEGIEIGQVQRRNLSIVARVLWYAADKKTFDATPDNAELNAFLKGASSKFAKYFEQAIDVETAEEHYNIDEYSDVTMLSKPTIFITQAEVHHTHQMLLANIETVAPDADDPLHVILGELGVPAWKGEIVTNQDGSTETLPVDWESPEYQTEVSLTLQNRFELPEEEDHSIKALFVRTKRLVIDVIRFQQGKNLKEILDTPVSDEAEQAHQEYVRDSKAKEFEIESATNAESKGISRGGNKRSSLKRLSLHGDSGGSTLREMKQQIYANIGQLEQVGLCSISDNYQGLLNSVAQDIRNQRIYRRQRKQELAKLRTTLKELAMKKEYMDEQVKFFDSYIESAKDQITKGKKASKSSAKFSFKKKQDQDDEGRHFGTYKYTGAQLKQKGVLVSVENVSDSKLKGITIEISRESVGTFAFKAKMMGFSMDKEVIDFEDLLELQYNNVAVTKMFTYCTINVNLLIYLLNKKFHSK